MPLGLEKGGDMYRQEMLQEPETFTILGEAGRWSSGQLVEDNSGLGTE